jgi:glycosyltransferase involved in cell wall biosynthesis
MRIAILSKMTAVGGGASKVAEVLAATLCDAGHAAKLFTLRPHPPNPVAQPMIAAPHLRRFVKFVHAGSELVAGQVLLPLEYPVLQRRLRDFDLVHIHDTWTAISPWTTRWIARRLPTVWTLHDCSAFTGGCLYMFDCRRHRQSCGCCPRKREEAGLLGRLDFTRASLAFKRRVHRNVPYTLVAPSSWMAAVATESGVFRPPVIVIPNGSDLTLFNPGNRPAARLRYDLGADERAVLLSAASLADRRKGGADACEILRRLAGAGLRLTVLLLGHGGDQMRPALAPLRTISLGYLADPAQVAAAYAAADVFLFPTRADNLPLSVQESMASATPVVSFAVGGVPEMVRHDETGMLAPPGDLSSLERHLAMLLTDDARRARLAHAARDHALREWSLDSFRDRHLNLYERILGTRHRP